MTKHIGKGTIFNLSIDSGTTYVAIACVDSGKPPGIEHDEIDMTCITDTAEDKQVSQPPNYTDCTLSLFWDPDETAATTDKKLKDLAVSGDVAMWRIDYPTSSGKSDSFSGRVKMYDPQEIRRNEPMKANITIAVTTATTTADTP